jgi:hypothetical protein
MLDELRERAIALGIDPTPFEDDEEALLAAIAAAEHPPMIRQAAALSVPQEVTVGDDGQLEGWPPSR